MDRKKFLEEKYCEINHLKNLLQTYPKEYCETIIKVMNKVFEEIVDYLEEEKEKVKKIVKKTMRDEIFTIEELAKFDGKNGNPPYVAIDGIVYDMTEVPKWGSGNHYGIMAGQVLDKQFEQCHVGNKSIIDNVTVVGRLEDSRISKVESIKEQSKIDIKKYRDEVRYYKIDEISKFDGCNGNLAYIVINGIVYDVTDLEHWKNGRHYGVSAGKDLSENFKTCHKGEENILKGLRVVGTIIE